MPPDAAYVQVLTSKIDAVTVYRAGARITRIADLPAAADGSTRRVSIPGLPLCLEDDSLRARVISPNKLGAPRAADVRVTLSVERSGEELRAADDAELEEAVIAVIEQKALVEQVQRELERLVQFELRARVADADRGDATSSVPRSPLAARLELLERRSSSWKTLHSDLESNKKELAKRQRRVKQLNDRNKRATSAREPRSDELRKCAVVSIQGGSASSEAQLAIEYQVRGARWAPAYVAHLERDGTSAKIGARAIVAQKTGEDWSGVRLTLVTASADTVTELPVLQSVRIGRRQPAAKTGWRPPPSGTDQLFADYERAFGKAIAPSGAISDHELFDDESASDIITATNAAIPPPPPPPAPSAMFMEERSGAGGLGGAMPLMVAAPAPMQAKGRGLSRSKKAGKARSTSVEGFADMPYEQQAASVPAPEPEVVRADETLLNYAGLVMAAPDAAGRGGLVRENTLARFRADLVRERWTVSFDIASAIATASRDADSVSTVALPTGHRLAESPDYDYSYFAESRVEVPSDGSYHSIALAAASGPCELRYQVCPRESCDVYRVARLGNPLDAPLLAGPIDVYLGGEFLLSSKTSFTPPGGIMRFGLGVEQAIRVVRNTSFRDDSAGLLGGSRELHHQLRVEAQNHLERAVELEVRERVPVLRDGEDDIKVEVGAVTPDWESFEPGDDEAGHPQLRGGYRWIEKLAPAGKCELKASYSIRISSKHELVGGNRREA